MAFSYSLFLINDKNFFRCFFISVYIINCMYIAGLSLPVGAGASELVNPEEEEEEKSVSQPVREGRGMGRRWSEVAHSALVSPAQPPFIYTDSDLTAHLHHYLAATVAGSIRTGEQ
jgi:hypothetical protein